MVKTLRGGSVVKMKRSNQKDPMKTCIYIFQISHFSQYMVDFKPFFFFLNDGASFNLVHPIMDYLWLCFLMAEHF